MLGFKIVKESGIGLKIPFRKIHSEKKNMYRSSLLLFMFIILFYLFFSSPETQTNW